jgi:hypothetical protein
MTAPFKTPIRLLWPLAVAAPLLAGCAGGRYLPPPPYPALAAYPPPGPRLAPMVRPGARVPPDAFPPVPDTPATKEPVSPVRLAPHAAGPAAPATPLPISAPAPGPFPAPTPEPTPRPLATIDARPPGTRCGWWELCNLWE